MATANQVYTVLNAVAKQQYGSTAVSVVDTSTMIALGDKVLSSNSDKEVFMNVLSDRIGRTIFSIRRYEESDANVVKHPFDFGAILQKIYVGLPELEADNQWNIGNEDYTPAYAPVLKPDARQKLFSNRNVFQCSVTVPDNILKTAFSGPVEMAVFISAIFMAQENRIQVAMEALINLCRAAFIARKINAGSKCGSINLLARYNARFKTTLAAADALYDAAFLRYASAQISMWTKRMRKMSKLFNEEGYLRHTPSSDLVLTVLDDFASLTASYLQADVFHKELVALPRYNTVAYWQGSGDDFEFNSTGTVSVKLSDTLTVTQTGVIAVAYDYEALGVMIESESTETQRNPRDKYTDYYHDVARGLFNDMSENGIVFYIADIPAPTNYVAGQE